MCPDLLDKNFKVLHLETSSDKFDLVCTETVKAKTTRNNSDFITYSKTKTKYSIWLDNSCYLINQWQQIEKEQALSWFKHLVGTKNW